MRTLPKLLSAPTGASLLLALALLLGGLRLDAQSGSPASPSRVVVVHDALVLESKFAALEALGAQRQLEITHIIAQSAEDQLVKALAGQDLLIVDCPRHTSYGEIEARLATLAETASLPARQVWVGRREQRWSGLDDTTGETIWQYYRHGGQRNFAHLADYLANLLHGAGIAPIPPPAPLPAAGAYHPEFPDQVSAAPGEILAFLRARHPEAIGVVGIGFHPSYIESIALDHVDAMVAEAEQLGLIGLPLFYSIGPDADLVSLTKGLPLEVLCHLQPVYHMGLAPQLEQLDIPVLQGIGWSDGDAESFRESRTGLSISATPIYLALPETVGLIDPVVAYVRGDDTTVSIPEQTHLLLAKARAYCALRQATAAERRVAIMYYNYPPGEHNLAASFLNVPRSLESISGALTAAGYTTEARPEDFWIEACGRTIESLHHPGQLATLLAEGHADRLPLEDYEAWFNALPEAARARINERWGPPAESPYLVEGAFVIPRVQVGQVSVLCQPPRGQPGDDDARRMYHDMRLPVNHYYLATYLWTREVFDAHAVVHLGTHGTLEWIAGKERGLGAFDDPFLALGDLPVIYPYIVDDVGEAIQARRRGRALIVSHQTPAFQPAGLHGELVAIHDHIHRYQQLEPGAVRERTAATLIEETLASETLAGHGWTREQMEADFDGFLIDLHDFLHELAKQSQPLGLHTFGRTASAQSRLTTVMQMLGEDFVEALLHGEEAEEVFVADFAHLTETLPYRWLQSRLAPSEGEPPLAPALPEWEEKARAYYTSLPAEVENEALLEALEGRFLSAGLGGDPLRVPEGLPTGKNLYGFDSSSIPTREAWETGVEAAKAMLAAHAEAHDAPPAKLAFSLWAVEAMRHGGVLESEALYCLGVRPTWNERGRVTGFEVISREELGRPRVDVVLSATGLYRDQFPNLMEHLARAAAEIAALDEADNPSYAHTRRLLADLRDQGLDEAEADYLARTRLFGSPTGVYGTGLEEAALASDTWENDEKLARLYLDRMSYAFGPDPARWGSGADTSALYAENLKGVEAAVLARSSNLYGMLSTDDPFQYLGGIGLAVRHLTGRDPDLLISNQRTAGAARIQTAQHFLEIELQTHSFHPGFLQSMQAEGFAGALELQDMVNNLWGWEVVDPRMVTAAQWQRLHEVYVNDALELGLDEWFEEVQPEALVRIIERMLEATRKGYWEPSETTQQELLETWTELTQRYELEAGNPAIEQFTASLALGFGLTPAAPLPEATDAAPEPAAPPTVQVSGQELRKVEAAPETTPPSLPLWWLALAVPLGLGVLRQLTVRR